MTKTSNTSTSESSSGTSHQYSEMLQHYLQQDPTVTDRTSGAANTETQYGQSKSRKHHHVKKAKKAIQEFDAAFNSGA